MTAPDATKQAVASAIAALGNWISVHSGDPGTTGANEVTGGSPAYARKQTAWGSPASGKIVGTDVSIDLPAGTYPYVGIWSAQVGGTFVLSIPYSVFNSAQAAVVYTPSINPS